MVCDGWCLLVHMFVCIRLMMRYARPGRAHPIISARSEVLALNNIVRYTNIKRSLLGMQLKRTTHPDVIRVWVCGAHAA